MDQQKWLLFAAAAAVRLLLFTAFPSLPDTLTGRVEISTPVTSFKRLQEGLFLYSHNVSPYDGGVFHQAPLLLPLFSLLPEPSSFPLPTNTLYIIMDLLSAYALLKIGQTGVAMSSRLFTSPRKYLNYNTTAIVASFLFNPLTIATCLARPTSIITNTLILWATAHASRGQSLSFLLALGLASYMSLYPILLFPPLACLCYDQQFSRTKPPSAISFTVTHFFGLVTVIASLLYASVLLTGSTQFLFSTYGTPLLLPDLTPNVGLWWYFFIEMFDSFREFFLGVFWLHMASYVGGLTFRIRKQPLFVVTALLGVIGVFQPYPSIADTSLFLGMVPLFRHVFPLLRYPFLETAVLMYATLLGPAFYHLWIYAGSGNANFFYAITLVWSLGLIIVVADLLYAVLRDEWEAERPEMKGKEARQI
ncbi:putative GPI transamidase component PIG-U [Microthyrium microscopicum]|uniref:Putative GPI transamidase component PIG-U n=1 Tax=Microthyrium microscopicum TaxID=703497 RepID=A0A6A6UIP2_9PEZI|nr:putative GPI transamidase component PIG-U [Microthyrium microscopicum]